jgi:hypothetical protein
LRHHYENIGASFKQIMFLLVEDDILSNTEFRGPLTQTMSDLGPRVAPIEGALGTIPAGGCFR